MVVLLAIVGRVPQLITRLSPRGRTSPAPEHLRFLRIRGITESVPCALTVKDDVTGAHWDLVIAVEHNAFTAHNQGELLGTRMTVPLVLRLPWREYRPPENHVLSARPGRIDKKLDGHSHPALVWPETGDRRDITDAYTKGICHFPLRLSLRAYRVPEHVV